MIRMMEVMTQNQVLELFNNAITNEKMAPYIKSVVGSVNVTSILLPAISTMFVLSIQVSVFIKVIVMVLFILHIIFIHRGVNITDG